MAIDIRIDQIRIGQIIAEDGDYPSRLLILSNKTPGTELFNGTISDTAFTSQAWASDTFFVISGSKFNVREQNSSNTNSGVVLFTGDVVVSGSLVVTTEQPTNYVPIQAVSSSFFGIHDLNLLDGNGSKIDKSMFYNLGTFSARDTVFLSSVGNSDACFVQDINFSSLRNCYSSSINIATSTDLGQSVFTNISGSQVTTVNSNYYSEIKNVQFYTTFGDFYNSVSNAYFCFSAGNYGINLSNSLGGAYISNINTTIKDNPNPSNNYPNIAIGNNNLVIQNSTNSFAISTLNTNIDSGFCGAIGGDTVSFANGVSKSYALFAENVVISSSNKIIVGTANHTSYFSGSLVAIQLSGALNYLSDGSTRAFTIFSTQSGPTHINTASNGQVQFGSMTRIGLGNYISSTATSSIPEIAGTAYLNKYEHEDVLGITGSYAKFRCILSTATSSTTAVVKLWNATSGGYVQIGGVGVYQLSTTSSSPTALVSSDLTDATLGLSMSNAVYEVHIYISGSGLPAIVNHHKSELLFAPKTLNGYS